MACNKSAWYEDDLAYSCKCTDQSTQTFFFFFFFLCLMNGSQLSYLFIVFLSGLISSTCWGNIRPHKLLNDSLSAPASYCGNLVCLPYGGGWRAAHSGIIRACLLKTTAAAAAAGNKVNESGVAWKSKDAETPRCTVLLSLHLFTHLLDSFSSVASRWGAKLHCWRRPWCRQGIRYRSVPNY